MASNGARSSLNSHLQKQILEELFVEGVYPDKKMRQELSVELGIEPEQIKCWFKNKLLSAEANYKREREENHALRMEQSRLRFENFQILQQVSDRRKCFGPANPIIQNLLDENLRLKAELYIATTRKLGYPVGVYDDGKNGDDDHLDPELRSAPSQSLANSSNDISDD